jgi:glycosyltransferase involved in cell wall biosynthesis
MKRISVAIPCYEMKGNGATVLQYSLDMLKIQTFKDFDVVISDDSQDDSIWEVYLKNGKDLDMHYVKNKNGKNAAGNTNNAIRHSTGKFVKILCQDDYLSSISSLDTINNHLTDDTFWMASAYLHTRDRINFFQYHLPHLNPNIEICNTIGTPSCITIQNMLVPLMDKYLTYCYDCDWYRRMIDKFGEPKILGEVTMINYLWSSSVSSGVSQELINHENEYILEKYKK